jgi:hypothetical protein
MLLFSASKKTGHIYIYEIINIYAYIPYSSSLSETH